MRGDRLVCWLVYWPPYLPLSRILPPLKELSPPLGINALASFVVEQLKGEINGSLRVLIVWQPLFYYKYIFGLKWNQELSSGRVHPVKRQAESQSTRQMALWKKKKVKEFLLLIIICQPGMNKLCRLCKIGKLWRQPFGLSALCRQWIVITLDITTIPSTHPFVLNSCIRSPIGGGGVGAPRVTHSIITRSLKSTPGECSNANPSLHYV